MVANFFWGHLVYVYNPAVDRNVTTFHFVSVRYKRCVWHRQQRVLENCSHTARRNVAKQSNSVVDLL